MMMMVYCARWIDLNAFLNVVYIDVQVLHQCLIPNGLL